MATECATTPLQGRRPKRSEIYYYGSLYGKMTAGKRLKGCPSKRGDGLDVEKEMK